MKLGEVRRLFLLMILLFLIGKIKTRSLRSSSRIPLQNGAKRLDDPRWHRAHNGRTTNPKPVILGLIIAANSRGGSTYGHHEDVELFQGDIVMTPEISEALNNSVDDTIVLPSYPGKIAAKHRKQRRLGRAVISKTSDLKWPVINGIVEIPYVFEDSIKDKTRAVILHAMDHWTENVPCITFVARTTQFDYLSFFAGKGCYSSVGHVGSGQRISIGPKCISMGIAAHEIAHALGFWHEQSRPDRDDYVKVLWDNIEDGKDDEFKKILGGAIDSRDVAYDINSLMHYGPRAFAKDKKSVTLETLDGRTDFGQREGLSAKDIEQAKLTYCTGCQLRDKMPGECPYYKHLGHCTSHKYQMHMDENCQRSCQCNGCEDNNVDCDAFARKGKCEGNDDVAVYVKMYCKKSCKLC